MNGEDVYSRSDTALAIFRRREVGLIYQFYNLIPVLNVVENITLPVLMDGRKVNDARLQELLDTLGLRGRAVGAALQACLDAVMDETLPNDRAALLGYAAENLQRFANS